MDAQILINSTDFSSYLVRLNRKHNYCAVAQEFDLELDISAPTINSYDPIVIYEDGVKVLTGYVSTVTKSAPAGTMQIHGMDKYKLATDFFVPTTYRTVAGQRTNYWIQFLLGLAGLSVTFTDGNGPFVVGAQDVGLDTVATLLEQFLQYSGWYAHVNQNGDVIVGKISQTPSGLQLVQGTNIITEESELSYDKTRNVAVVFGGVDVTFNEFRPIFSKARVDDAFLPNDQIAVVGNHLIGDQESADQFANELVKAFSKPTFVKKYQVLGNPNLITGQYIEVYSDIFTGNALVTSIDTHFDEGGYLMDVTLDDLCPRVVAAIRGQADLYAGTRGNGVWKYSIFENQWSNLSTGLTNLYINDLSVDNGMFIVSTPSGVYTKLGTNAWAYQHLPFYSGSTLGTLQYPGVYADLAEQKFNAIVSVSGTLENRAWFYTGTIASGTHVSWSGYPVTVSGDGTLLNYAKDLEGYYGSKFIVEDYGFYGPQQEKLIYVVSGAHIYKTSLNGADTTAVVLTSGGHYATDPEFSHDLSYVIYAADQGSGEQIYRCDSNGANTIQLTSSTGANYAPSWSPDDTRIVFISTRTGISQLFVMNNDGSNVTNITNESIEYTHTNPNWGFANKISYSRIGADGYAQVWFINPNGSGKLQTTIGAYGNYMPYYNPDGDTITFSHDSDGNPTNDAYSMDASGNNLTQITHEGGINDPQLTQRGDAVIYEKNGKIYGIGRVYEASAERVEVTSDWAINGIYINQDTLIEYLVVSTAIGGEALYLINTATLELSQFTDKANAAESNNVVSEDHTTIAFLSSNPAFPAENEGSFIYTYRTGVLTKLDLSYLPTGTKNNIAISPDATKLMFQLFELGGIYEHLYMCDIDGSNAVLLYTNNSFDDPVGTPASGGFRHDDPTQYWFYHGTADANDIYVNGSLYAPNTLASMAGWDYLGRKILYFNTEVDYSSDATPYNLLYDATQTIWNVKFTEDHTRLIVTSGFINFQTNFMLKVTDTSTATDGLASSNWFDGRPDDKMIYFYYQVTHVVAGHVSYRTIWRVKMKTQIVRGTKPSYRFYSPYLTRVLRTDDNATFTEVLRSYNRFAEVNVDTSAPLFVYGPSGIRYSYDEITFSGYIATGYPIRDMAARINGEDVTSFATTNIGIYKTIASGIPVLVNSVGATEIVSRTYGSGEVFFSIAGTVKKSTDECVTYSDVGTGLPGSTITVLRMEKN
jgi:Tol biopolymer transport system component